MLLFTSLAIIGATQDASSNDITATKTGMTWVAIIAIIFCVLGAVILFFYKEKKIMKLIAKDTDKDFMAAIDAEKDPGEEKVEEPVAIAQDVEVKDEEPAPVVEEAKVEEPAPVEEKVEEPAEEAKPEKKAPAKKAPAKKTPAKKAAKKEEK